MEIKSVIKQFDPPHVLQSVLASTDQLNHKRFSAIKGVLLKKPTQFSMALFSMILNVASVAREIFALILKLPQAGLKLTLRGIRKISGKPQLMKGFYSKLDSFSDCGHTSKRIGAQTLGVFSSVAGMALFWINGSKLNIELQTVLGNYTPWHSVDNVKPVSEKGNTLTDSTEDAAPPPPPLSKIEDDEPAPPPPPRTKRRSLPPPPPPRRATLPSSLSGTHAKNAGRVLPTPPTLPISRAPSTSQVNPAPSGPISRSPSSEDTQESQKSIKRKAGKKLQFVMPESTPPGSGTTTPSKRRSVDLYRCDSQYLGIPSLNYRAQLFATLSAQSEFNNNAILNDPNVEDVIANPIQRTNTTLQRTRTVRVPQSGAPVNDQDDDESDWETGINEPTSPRANNTVRVDSFVKLRKNLNEQIK